MTEPRIHVHVWEHSEEHDDYNLRFDSELEWTGTYDDHIQFSGPGFGSKIHYEIRVWFKDLEKLIELRDTFKEDNDGT